MPNNDSDSQRLMDWLDQNNNHRDMDDNVVDQPVEKRRTTKKGIIITALIVTAMIGASFIVYFIP
ncbi:MAG: hypothetical protein ACRD5J_02010 [Nitrososphaeraceae archaeon]